MRLIIAILLPFVLFFTIGRPLAGIICLILQITLIGWLPAAIWAVYALSQYNTDRKIADALGGGGAAPERRN
ncbi:MAG: YqaE/Pmp3 family membrane protein [Alphaproteobacteria bacterium]